MECPSNELLLKFIEDPDATVTETPWFEEHLGDCAQCRLRIDRLSQEQSSPTLLMHVLGDKHAPATVLPEIAGYQIEQWVGSGGHGTVYCGIQLSTGRSVAIKFISRLHPQRSDRLLLEQAAMLRLDHPHIVALIDAGSTPTGIYLVYAWMKTNLSSYIKEIEPADLLTVLDLLVPICEAVSHLHSHEIIHRDVKPSNILLNAQGQPKLTDFGLAKDLSDKSSSPSMTEPVGTPGYMAPEQTGLVDEHVGYETDVYGLGALMYAMVAARPPFQAANSLHVLHQVIYDLPIPLRRLRPDISIDYESVCMKCLSKHKHERYSSALQLLAELQRLRRGQRVLARPMSQWRQSAHWLSRRPVVRNSLVACLSLTLICVAWFIFAQRQFEIRARRELQKLTVSQLLTAEAADLPQIYAVLSRQPPAELIETLNQFESRTQSDELRLALANPQSLTWDTLLHGIEHCQVQDLLPIRAQLSAPNRFNEELKPQVKKYLREGQQDETVLRLTAICPQEFKESFDEQLCKRLLTALAANNESQIPIWQHCLQPHAEALTDQLLRLLENQSEKNLLTLQVPVNLCLLWNGGRPARLIELMEHSTTQSLSFLEDHRELLTEPLKAYARDRWQKLLQFEQRGWQDTTTPPLIIDLVNQYYGAASSRGGCLTAVPAEQLPNVFQQLNQQGYSATSAHPLLDQECSAYSICFRQTLAQSELSHCQTPEELFAQIQQRQSDGWYPVSIWSQLDYPEFIVLWTTSQRDAGTLVEYDPTSGHLHSESFASQMPVNKSVLKFTWNQRVFGFYRELPRSVTPSVFAGSSPPDARRSNAEKSNCSRIFLDTESVDRYIRSSRIQQFNIVSGDFRDFQRKIAELLGNGFLPSDVFVDSNYCVRAFCDFDRQQVESNQWCRAICALTCWLCGDREPLLSDLACRPFAHARGILIGELPRINRDVEELFQVVADVTSPDQINGLLVAAGSLDWNKLDTRQRTKIQQRLQMLGMHGDSGVHFAAKWLLETKLNSHLDVATIASRVPTTEHRSWFYSPSGIPFIVINPREVQVITDELRTPWTQAVLSNAVYCQRPFAISATEITQKVARQYTSTVEFPTAQGTSIDSEPVTSINYHSILGLCQRLSEEEGLSADEISRIIESPGTESVSGKFLNCEGYRLPTGIEWEMACRCGALGSTFFGDSSAYLSTYAWNSDNTDLTTMPVGTLAPSPWGLHDILGNAYEANLGSVGSHNESLFMRTQVDYRVDKDSSINVRGGSFLSNRVYCASGTRHGIPHYSYDRNSGFRIVRTLPVVPYPATKGPRATQTSQGTQ